MINAQTAHTKSTIDKVKVRRVLEGMGEVHIEKWASRAFANRAKVC